MFQSRFHSLNNLFNRYRRLAALILVPIGLLVSAFAIYDDIQSYTSENSSAYSVSRQMLSEALGGQITQNVFPEKIALPLSKGDDPAEYRVNYTLASDLQNHAEALLRRYKPDYGAIVMMDARTGEILAMTSFEKNNSENDDNLALKSGYPAASVFKVITAAAAVDKAGITPEHRIAFNGGNYTLYKKNVLSDNVNRWTRFITLKEAFAMSINTAFGRLTLESLEPEDLSEYARKFFFNKEIPSDFPVETSSIFVPDEKGYALAQVASGYNRFNTLSPVHGAMIASAIVNEGQIPAPYLVKSIENDQHEVIYSAQPQISGQAISAKSANKVKQMMEQTVLTGTSRKTFRRIVRERQFKEVEMGGKTGHFTGTNPRGRTDWFVGYASDEDSRIAIAAITVNVKYWTVKSSALSEMMFRRYFKNKLEEAKMLSDTDEHDGEAERPARKTARARKHRS
ncbi:penicillin-binding transpeptidase domain-containing protein [Pseudobdellovibrio exovorus]|uniref:Penicillin-binding protein transpeptidase domain-containing protein n=1 Tax=Pseudobdellovibrio exovorus JSS TaxID=1184267 RepID=M4VB68_9BACT|nr:penicillin-binding transpeptidase domain-containing protein [Pseudobdellovibrio exovorus]AGH96458.1 penicillin-binding protein transpeptidase domain-containing protein [Pseudobdellovibrio exovorus JSS]